VLVRPHAIADRGQVSDQIVPVLRRQPEIEHPVEMRHHLIVAVEAPIMKIRCVEIGICAASAS
jgi:hypothetical protein